MNDADVVYDQIASEFDKTRHSVWKHVKIFLQQLPPFAIGADVGVGNGKNFRFRKDIIIVGNDLSWEQACIASESSIGEGCKGDILLCNALNLPYKEKYFDFAICIAVVHHVRSTKERMLCVEEILRCVRKGGSIMITLWAREQLIKRSWVCIQDNDYMVPWTMKNKTVHQRFYHLSSENEINNLCKSLEQRVESIRYWFDMENWYIEIIV